MGTEPFFIIHFSAIMHGNCMVLYRIERENEIGLAFFLSS